MKKVFIFGFVLALLIAGGFYFFSSTGNIVSAGTPLVMYKSPSCGCCVGNSGVLEQNGFGVEIIPMNDLNLIKRQYNIPSEMQSCHTSVIGNYFVEGHVPMAAINKLLDEQPNIDGIALPRMPAGAPGMPGVKNEEWVIYALKDGKYTEFMKI